MKKTYQMIRQVGNRMDEDYKMKMLKLAVSAPEQAVNLIEKSNAAGKVIAKPRKRTS